MKHLWLCLCVCAGVAAPALADDSDTVSTATVYACADISGDMERLACYDAAVGRLKSAEESGDVVTVTRSEVEEVRRESFGFSLPSLPKFSFGNDQKDEIKQVTLPVDRVSTGPRGAFIVYLENGQVWEQIDNKKVYYSRKLGVENATIKSAALGSFMMKFDDGVLFRVRRVQ